MGPIFAQAMGKDRTTSSHADNLMVPALLSALHNGLSLSSKKLHKYFKKAGLDTV